ncbi:MAG: hypothetical protein KDA93_15750 [Planctomycetaceae bacterium]|nr:hypothetical protein [Planctomycetaceae bacterium]
MIPTSQIRRQLKTSLALCVTTTALVVGLSLSGCVKSPRDILASFRGQKAEIEEAAEESESIADAGKDDADTATVSQTKDDPTLPQQEFGTQNLLDRLLSRNKTEDDRVTTDPFVGADDAAREKSDEIVSKSEAEVKRRAASLEELLEQTKRGSTSPADTTDDLSSSVARNDRLKSKTGDDNQFVTNFDSRLDQLKADLQRETDAAGSELSDDVNPFAEFAASKTANQTPVSSVSFESGTAGTTERELPTEHQHPLKNATLTAKDRVKSLMNQAHDDWESWKLEDAYRKTLAAQELAVLEGVEFDVTDERPGDLAKRIASDIRKDSLSTTLSKAEPWTEEANSHDDAFSEIASQTFESFASGTPNIGWQTVSSQIADSTEGGIPEPTPQFPETEVHPSANSGVNLLPPSSDDFPSEAEGESWSTTSANRYRRTHHHESTEQNIVNLAWHDDESSTTNDASSQPDWDDRPALVRYESAPDHVNDEVSRESSEELLAHVAASRNRVLYSDGPQLPALPAPDTDAIRRRNSEPVQVAATPPMIVGMNDRQASSVGTSAALPASQAATTNTSVASVWYSRPLWFVGGLILLMLSMRLLSRRSTVSI